MAKGRHQEAKRTRVSAFWKCYLVYVLLLALLCTAAWYYVRSCLIRYEETQSERYVAALLEHQAGNGELERFLDERYFSAAAQNPFDNMAARREELEEKLLFSKLSFVQDENSYDTAAPIYTLLADGAPFLTLHLEQSGSETKLGILTLSEWAIRSAVLLAPEDGAFRRTSDGTYAISVRAPSDAQVLCNGVALTAEQQTGALPHEEKFQYVAPYVAVPQLLTYEVTGLAFEPTVCVLAADGSTMAQRQKDGETVAELDFPVLEDGGAFASAVDALAIGETWSRLMTDDLAGERHGIAQVRRFLIPGSYLDKMATDFAGSVDITFVSGHSLDSFTEESVSNYIAYSPTCFSCDVSFRKNMTILKGGSKRTDVFSSRMFFGCVDGEWYLLDMQGVTA